MRERARYRALALPAILLGMSLSSGCGTANEESLADTKRGPVDPNAPASFKSYGDKVQYDAEQAKKKAAEKGTGGKTAAPVAPPATKTAQDQPKP